MHLYFAFMGRKTSANEKVFFKQCQLFLKENIQCLKVKLNPCKQFDFSDSNILQVRKMFAEIEDP